MMKPRLLVLLLAVLFVCFPYGKAIAHAELEASNPADGAKLAEPVKEITLSFSEEIQPVSTMTIFDQEKNPIKPDHIEIAGKKMSATFDKPLDKNVYTVQWQNAADDGHTSKGSFSFTVGTGASESQGKAPVLQNQGQSGIRRYAPIAAVVIVVILLTLAVVMLKPKRKTGKQG